MIAVFVVLQRKLTRVYASRTFLESLDEDEKTPKQSAGFGGFRKELAQLADEFVLGHSSIDNYLWLRFFKMLTLMCLGGSIITWPILFPVNATGGGGQSGIDILSFSNINPGPRYFAQAISAWIFLAFVMFLITKEALYYVQLRQAYFLSPHMTSRISSKTVLFTDVPESCRDEAYIRRIMSNVRTVWIVSDPGDLEDLVQDRDDAANKLETGECKLIKNYVKKQVKDGNDGLFNDEDDHSRGRRIEVVQKDRPTHKTKPIIGSKVDTVDWSRGELHRLIPEVLQKQSEHRAGKTKALGAVFIEFETVRAAQAGFMLAAHHMPFQMTPKDYGMPPSDVIWKNVAKPFWLVKLIGWAGTAFIAFLCIFWTIPVGFIGILTNIDAIIDMVPFLSFINQIPSQILGIVTGLLPVILLAVLMLLVPIFCNLIASQFAPTQGAVQLQIQSWYFPFQVIQVFLITTFTSGAASVVTKIINDPTGAPTLLAKNLPKASTFYVAYFILQGLIPAAIQVLNLVPLLFFLVLGKILDTTPRKMFNRYTQLAGIGWGSLYPKYTNLGVIALAYSTIAPLVLGFATIGFGCLYLAYRYNCFFTIGTTVSTRGRSYARALQQLTVGIYISEICLIGLFAIGIGDSAVSAGPLVLMIILLIITVIWNLQLRKAMTQLTLTLPADLMAETEDNQRNDVEKHGVSMESPSSSHSPDGQEARHPKAQMPEQASKSKSGSIIRHFEFLMPGKRSLVMSPLLSHPVRPYTERERREAYLNPAFVAECPVIWLPRDSYGLSHQEVQDSRDAVRHEALQVTDEGAWYDEKGKLQWDQEVRKAPIWEDEPLY